MSILGNSKKSYSTVLAILLAGCDSIPYDKFSHDGFEVQQFQSNGRTWRVYAKPDELTLTVRPSGVLGSNAHPSNDRVSTHGAARSVSNADLFTPAPYSTAAKAYLEPKGCDVTGTSKVLEWQHEFTYTYK